jgi:UDP-N-acetylglucosamine 4,6-dehydratase/5-epimerase
MNEKRIFITGGAGFLGTHIVDRYHTSNDITVYSRDEAKHYYLSKKYPKVNFIIGDVRHRDHLIRSCKDHEVGIFAASLKQIDICSKNIEESAQTIIQGSFNSKIAALDNNFESACFISTDKSRSATTVYGAMKYVAGESFILNNEKVSTRCSTALYGNVMNSTGSLIPLIRNAIQNKIRLTLYSKDMTRFMISVDDAINLIDTSLKLRDVTVIPNLNSFLVKDVFDIYKEEFGLEYTMGTPRVNEKIHEIMSSEEEIPRMKYLKGEDCYMMDPYLIHDTVKFPNSEYSSKDVVIDKERLYIYLKENNFYL